MIVLLELIALGVFILIGVNLWNGAKRNRLEETPPPNTIDGTAKDVSSPGKYAAETLRDFEVAQNELKKAYPALFAMLGGYLNSYTINEAGGLETAVKAMIDDWQGRSEEVSRELTKLLADNESEEECRAVVVAACDAEFDQEGYRAWLTWLLGRFNNIGG